MKKIQVSVSFELTIEVPDNISPHHVEREIRFNASEIFSDAIQEVLFDKLVCDESDVTSFELNKCFAEEEGS